MKRIGLVITKETIKQANEFCPNVGDRTFTPTHCPAGLAMREQVSDESLVGITTATISGEPLAIPERLSHQILRWVETGEFRPGVYPIDVPNKYASK